MSDTIEQIRAEARRHIPDDYFEVTAGVVNYETDLYWSLPRNDKFYSFSESFSTPTMFWQWLLVIRPKKAR